MAEDVVNSGLELQNAIAKFAELQREHKALLAAGKLKSLPSWLRRRQQLTTRLHACLEGFEFDSIAADSELAVMIKNSFEKVLCEEESLVRFVKTEQGELKEKLRTMRKGKTVLKGYSSYRGADGSNPKVLSSRT